MDLARRKVRYARARPVSALHARDFWMHVLDLAFGLVGILRILMIIATSKVYILLDTRHPLCFWKDFKAHGVVIHRVRPDDASCLAPAF